MQLSQIGEFGLIERLAKIIGKPPKDVILGVGDDAAVVKCRMPNAECRINEVLLLITTDTLVENVHFKIEKKKKYFFNLGCRALAVNISDIAAMGGLPTYAVVTLGAPKKMTVRAVEELYRGIKRIAQRHEITIVGGDTVSSPSALIISITLLGEVERKYLLTRSGAKVGDLICVTGEFGGPAASGFSSRCTLPDTRLFEARTIAQAKLASAMIDSSDGLVRSVVELGRASQVGTRIWEEKVPLARGATIDQALSGGEEYELVFTVAPSRLDQLKKLSFQTTVVGEISEKKSGFSLIDKEGKIKRVTNRGYEHFKK